MQDGKVNLPIYPSSLTAIEWRVLRCSLRNNWESPTLSEEEHLKVIGETIDQVDGKVPVIAGTGANSTSEAQLTQKADSLQMHFFKGSLL